LREIRRLSSFLQKKVLYPQTKSITMTEAIEKALKEEFSDSTVAECYRFVHAAEAVYKKTRKSNSEKEKLIHDTASQKLEEYLDWRSLHGLDYDDQLAKDTDDSSVWEWAVQKALFVEEAKKRQIEEAKRASRSSSSSSSNSKSTANKDKNLVDYDSHLDMAVEEEEEREERKISEQTVNILDGGGTEINNNDNNNNIKKTLPQLIFRRTDPNTGKVLQDKNGTELIHVLAAKVDRFAASNETWAMAVALYIDFYVDRNSKYCASIFVDARAGEGWPNPKLIMAMSLIGQIVSEIEKRHPSRCKTLIIFPLPRALTMIWGSIKGYFSPEMNEMMIVCSGPSIVGSPLPKKMLEIYVDGDVIDILEKCRIDLYNPKKE